MIPQAAEKLRGHGGKSGAHKVQLPRDHAWLSWKHLQTHRRRDPLALCAETSSLKRSGLVSSTLQFQCFLSWQLHNWECREIKRRRKYIRAGKCQVDLLQHWGAGVLGKFRVLPSPALHFTHHFNRLFLALLVLSGGSCLLQRLDHDLVYSYSFRVRLCSRFNEQNPCEGADILMPPIDTLHWDNELCTAFKTLANPGALGSEQPCLHLGCN